MLSSTSPATSFLTIFVRPAASGRFLGRYLCYLALSALPCTSHDLCWFRGLEKTPAPFRMDVHWDCVQATVSRRQFPAVAKPRLQCVRGNLPEALWGVRKRENHPVLIRRALKAALLGCVLVVRLCRGIGPVFWYARTKPAYPSRGSNPTGRWNG